MNPSETAELMENIRRIRDTFQIAIMLIEHDMSLVMGICEGICVLDYGKIIAKGTPDEIRANPEGHRGLSWQEGGEVIYAESGKLKCILRQDPRPEGRLL